MTKENDENESLIFNASEPDVGKRLDLYLSEKSKAGRVRVCKN